MPVKYTECTCRTRYLNIQYAYRLHRSECACMSQKQLRLLRIGVRDSHVCGIRWVHSQGNCVASETRMDKYPMPVPLYMKLIYKHVGSQIATSSDVQPDGFNSSVSHSSSCLSSRTRGLNSEPLKHGSTASPIIVSYRCYQISSAALACGFVHAGRSHILICHFEIETILMVSTLCQPSYVIDYRDSSTRDCTQISLSSQRLFRQMQFHSSSYVSTVPYDTWIGTYWQYIKHRLYRYVCLHIVNGKAVSDIHCMGTSWVAAGLVWILRVTYTVTGRRYNKLAGRWRCTLCISWSSSLSICQVNRHKSTVLIFLSILITYMLSR